MNPEDALASISDRLAKAGSWREPVHDDPVSDMLLSTAWSVAAMDVTVLLTGESGVGKEVIARYIHDESPRRDAPFVAINCAAVTESLIESELFGHEKGAFSGAATQHRGVFEQASGGTLLLDEVSEMPTNLQSKLLRVLQERVVRRVGGTKDVPVDIRLISTSNRDLPAFVESGGFRSDLYYRLAVFPLKIPPLRDRPGDIPGLARRYLAHFSEAFERSVEDFTPAAMSALRAHKYPGNVRELVNVIQRAIVLCGNASQIDLPHIRFETTNQELEALAEFGQPDVEDSGKPKMNFVVGERPLTEVRRTIILETLRHFEGDRSATARSLGLSTRTIRNKLRDYRERDDDES